MTALEQAIKDAVEKGGYTSPLTKSMDEDTPFFMREVYDEFRTNRMLLHSEFWKALGVARGWEEDWAIFESRPRDKVSGALWLENCPRYYQHRLIDALAAGKTPEEFFASLV